MNLTKKRNLFILFCKFIIGVKKPNDWTFNIEYHTNDQLNMRNSRRPVSYGIVSF